MTKRKTIPIAAGVLLLSVLAALSQTAPGTVADTSKGKVLVDAKGMTLYVFDRDTAGTSNCNSQCAVNWPPLLAAAGDTGSGQWTAIARADQSRQWAYKGRPTYTFSKDEKPGDVKGDGVNNVWHIAAP
jgi:predicted lipoprotein with Yx(FWY)xxD motif